MLLSELLERYTQEIERSREMGATAPVANLLERVVKDLRSLSEVPDSRIEYKIERVAALKDVSTETIRRRCRSGFYPGARKTSGATGDWRIPAEDLDTLPTPRKRRRIR